MSLPLTESSVAEEMRMRLRELADELIPGADGMPSASEVGVAERQLDRVLAARPDLAAPLRDALTRPASAPATEWLGRLAADDPAAHDAFLLVVVGGYYIDPEVRRRLGYRGQEPLLVQPELIPNYVDEGLLDTVLERGAVYREVPDE